MRIIHFSDWHWSFDRLPEADLYICTGDMYSNYPRRKNRTDELREWDQWEYFIHPEHELRMQLQAAEAFVAVGGFKRFLGSPDAPIVCVPGNHDFAPLAPLFAGCDVTEITDNRVHEVLGLRITGHSGIPRIYGNWNHEMERVHLIDRYKAMPEADIYITHYAPAGMLDGRTKWFEGYGLEEILNHQIYERGRGMHCFGHIHEDGGEVRQEGDCVWSNAATTWNALQYKDGKFGPDTERQFY